MLTNLSPLLLLLLFLSSHVDATLHNPESKEMRTNENKDHLPADANTLKHNKQIRLKSKYKSDEITEHNNDSSVHQGTFQDPNKTIEIELLLEVKPKKQSSNLRRSPDLDLIVERVDDLSNSKNETETIINNGKWSIKWEDENHSKPNLDLKRNSIIDRLIQSDLSRHSGSNDKKIDENIPQKQRNDILLSIHTNITTMQKNSLERRKFETLIENVIKHSQNVNVDNSTKSYNDYQNQTRLGMVQALVTDIKSTTSDINSSRQIIRDKTETNLYSNRNTEADSLNHTQPDNMTKSTVGLFSPFSPQLKFNEERKNMTTPTIPRSRTEGRSLELNRNNRMQNDSLEVKLTAPTRYETKAFLMQKNLRHRSKGSMKADTTRNSNSIRKSSSSAENMVDAPSKSKKKDPYSYYRYHLTTESKEKTMQIKTMSEQKFPPESVSPEFYRTTSTSKPNANSTSISEPKPEKHKKGRKPSKMIKRIRAVLCTQSENNVTWCESANTISLNNKVQLPVQQPWERKKKLRVNGTTYELVKVKLKWVKTRNQTSKMQAAGTVNAGSVTLNNNAHNDENHTFVPSSEADNTKSMETTKNHSETTKNHTETTKNHSETTWNHTETTKNHSETTKKHSEITKKPKGHVDKKTEETVRKKDSKAAGEKKPVTFFGSVKHKLKKMFHWVKRKFHHMFKL